MSSTTVKLQIPLDKSLRDKVEKHAKAMGFSSIQEFTRVMFTIIVRDNIRFSLDGKISRLDAPESPPASPRLP